MNTQAKARVELDMLMFKLEAVEKMMREMQISVNSIKQSINPSYVESYHCITSGDKQEYQQQQAHTEAPKLQNQSLQQNENNVSKQPQTASSKEVANPFKTPVSATEKSEWPPVDWRIIKTLRDTISKLPEFDWSDEVLTLTQEAYKAGANSIFKCNLCKEVVRGCNLCRCERGHLTCYDCLSNLETQLEGNCVYHLCRCGARLRDAYGDDNMVIVDQWGYGVRRRIGRQRGLCYEDFVKQNNNLDCK